MPHCCFSAITCVPSMDCTSTASQLLTLKGNIANKSSENPQSFSGGSTVNPQRNQQIRVPKSQLPRKAGTFEPTINPQSFFWRVSFSELLCASPSNVDLQNMFIFEVIRTLVAPKIPAIKRSKYRSPNMGK